MVEISVRCIHCDSLDIVKMGKQVNGKTRCKCKACGKTFQIQYTNNGAKPQTKQLIINMAANGRGIRDISRNLHISSNTALTVLKKQTQNTQISANPKKRLKKINRLPKTNQSTHPVRILTKSIQILAHIIFLILAISLNYRNIKFKTSKCNLKVHY